MSTDKVDAREAWANAAMKLVMHVAELYARASMYNTETLHCAMLAKKGELRAFLLTQPEGYVLLPVELTETLLIAGRDSVTLEHGVDAMLQYAWSQIIDAAQEGK